MLKDNFPPLSLPCPHEGIKMHGSVVVGTKGQVVIPSDVRKMLGVQPGDILYVVTKHEKAVAMIKMDDLEEFISYLQQELEAVKASA